MRLLCVANWSEGRNESTLAAMRHVLAVGKCKVHFDGSDPDHNRIVTAFSGGATEVDTSLFSLAEIAFEAIDMHRHDGVHPRVGALDVCPFIVLEGNEVDALDFATSTAQKMSAEFELPIFLYEKSETGKHAADLPSLRRGQYEGLFDRVLTPDFGPRRANPRLGVTVLGVRNWLIAMNVNLRYDKLDEARQIARQMRLNRNARDDTFAGVRALGLELKRQKRVQVSMNLTMPDRTAPDNIIRWIAAQEEILETQLIGVIREADLQNSKLLPIKPQQVLRPI